jgi:hypothetical protein
MSGAPTVVMKGGIIRKIDKRLANPDRKYFDELKNWAENGRLSDLALQGNHGTLRPDQKKHADVDWFGEGEGWWPKLEHKEKKVRAAYTLALDIATQYDPPRPIRTFWLAGVPDTFQCYVHDTGEETGGVVVFWVTPAVPKVSAPSRDETPDDLWVIAGPEEIAAIRARFPDDYQTEEPVEFDEGVFVFKSTGY